MDFPDGLSYSAEHEWVAVEGTRARHSVHVWLPERTQRLIVGRLPARISFSSKGAGTPSSWTKTTPGRPSAASAVAPAVSPRPRAPRPIRLIRTACTVR